MLGQKSVLGCRRRVCLHVYEQIPYSRGLVCGCANGVRSCCERPGRRYCKEATRLRRVHGADAEGLEHARRRRGHCCRRQARLCKRLWLPGLLEKAAVYREDHAADCVELEIVHGGGGGNVG